MEADQEFLKAVMEGEHARVAELLELNPALANARSASGLPAVLLALYYGQPETARLLIQKGAQLDIFAAAAAGIQERVQELLQADPGLANAVAADGFQPLGLAAFFGHLQVVADLLANGAEVNSPSRNSQRVMPLHSAAANSHLEITRLLLEHGAQVNARQADDFTPLHAAAQNDQPELVKLFLAYGANPRAIAEDGKTPLDLAEEAGASKVAELLKFDASGS